jgi:hypothetical protein
VSIAFDADSRDFEYVESDKYEFKELHILNRLAAENDG